MLVPGQMSFVNRQKGFTLMEVMIASFVLAVGMLGSTAMMLRGHQEAEDTNYEAIAMQLASNMIERMRSNLEGVDGVGNLNRYYDNISTAAAGRVDCSATCTPAEIAEYHNYRWREEMDVLLPNANPSGTVTAISPNTENSVFEITVRWDRVRRIDRESSEFISSADDDYTIRFQP